LLREVDVDYRHGVKHPRREWLFVALMLSSCWLVKRLPEAHTPSQTSAQPTQSANGGDVPLLPALHPHAQWLPIRGLLAAAQPMVEVVINGTKMEALLDTGAQQTLLSKPVAARLGMDLTYAENGWIKDAHGDLSTSSVVVLEGLQLGLIRVENIPALVAGDHEDLVLIGMDVLHQYDVLFALDEGMIGLFKGGEGPRLPGAVDVTAHGDDTQMRVFAEVDGQRGTAQFELVIDSGANATTLPSRPLMEVQAGSDVNYKNVTQAVVGERTTSGMFDVQLRLNDVHAGRVIGHPSVGGGLLGTDVLMRHRTLVSNKSHQLQFSPIQLQRNQRNLGPSGGACEGCISVTMAPIPAGEPARPGRYADVCLQVDVDQAYRGQTMELLLLHEALQRVGMRMSAFLTVGDNGFHHCFALWDDLRLLGVTPTSTWSIQWVRTEGIRWPCDPMREHCMMFHGPLHNDPT
jgi:clan AA aspartic protease (TIGR02281 family)